MGSLTEDDLHNISAHWDDYETVGLMADEASKGTLGFHAKREQQLRLILKELVRVRNNWLRSHGAYMNQKKRAAAYRVFYG